MVDFWIGLWSNTFVFLIFVMFWSIVLAILFVWLLFKIAQSVHSKLRDPIGRAERIIDDRIEELKKQENIN